MWYFNSSETTHKTATADKVDEIPRGFHSTEGRGSEGESE